jgi:hypothetical protein
MKQIYLSGPVTGRPEEECARHFSGIAGEIRWRAGTAAVEATVPFDPVSYCRAKVSPGAPWHEYMRRCIPRLAGSDGIALLQGWEKSRGARLELDLADKLKIPLVYIEPPVDIDGLSRFPAELNQYFQARYVRCLQRGYTEEFSEECALYETANRYLDPHGFEYLDEPSKEENHGQI